MIVLRIRKQPYDKKDYEVDYAEWLGDTGDSLDSVIAVVECLTNPADTALTVFTQITTTRCVVWAEGGTDGMSYKIGLRVDTVMGRRDEIEIICKVKDD